MIGILPAAGSATRIHGLPKYLLPVPGGYLLERHINAMLAAGCHKVLMGAGYDNWKQLNDFSPDIRGQAIRVKDDFTMTQTVRSLRPEIIAPTLVNECHLFGMPDTYFDGDNPYTKLARELDRCDVAVAVFRARPGQHSHGGMVSFSHNRVTEVIDKPAETNLRYIWGALAWKPAFWDCLTPDMPHVGYGLPVAIERGLNVRAVVCEGGFWDCGTSTEYFEMIRTLTAEGVGA